MIAVWNCGLSGFEIQDIEYGIHDYVIGNWMGDARRHRCRIYDSARRGPYFRVQGRRIYAADCMRV